ncbi:MAG: META domain-containing protein [Cytophagales bacterium]|nr:META domain-containing protein [Cytophagales bacterium]
MKKIVKRSMAFAAITICAFACKPSDKLNQVVGLSKSTLEDTRWVLEELNNQPVSTQNQPFLVFASKSMVLSGFGGCNQLAGSYETARLKLKCNNVVATRMYCDVGQLENDFLTLLQKVNRYHIEGDTLSLYEDAVLLGRLKAQR